MQRVSQLFLSAIIACGVLGFVLPSYAAGNYYAFAGDPASSDANSCRTTADPCATLNGAIDKVLDSATPSDATIYAKGVFTESVEVYKTELGGLTITAHDRSNVPVIDATGYAEAITVGGPIDGFTLSYFELTGANNYGVYAYGSSSTYNQHLEFSHLRIHDLDQTNPEHYGMYISSSDYVDIHDVTIESLGSSTTDTFSYAYVYGIYLYKSDHSTVRGNTIQNLTASIIDTNQTYIYTNVYGITVQEADDLLVKNNTITNLVSSTTTEKPSAYNYNYMYGISLSNNMDAVVRDNTVQGLSVENLSNGAWGYGYGYQYGISAAYQNRTTLRDNTIMDLTNTVTVHDTESGVPLVYGMVVSGVENNVIRGNVIKNLYSLATNGNGSAQLYGIDVNDAALTAVYDNTIKDSIAEGVESGAINKAIRLVDSPDSNVYHNRIGDFTAVGPTDTARSVGVELGYNSGADVFNNAIYFTAPVNQTTADGISLLSGQSTPVRIYHNTISGLLTCLNVSKLGVTKFMNNICSMTNAGAYGVQVTSEHTDLTLLQSNANIFYNATGALSFNDTSEGVLVMSDWQSGIYGQDAASKTKNPKLNLDNPAGKKYLHLKKKSPAKNAGKSNLSFGSDSEMTTLLGKDWDGKNRFADSKPDIGFDEYHK